MKDNYSMQKVTISTQSSYCQNMTMYTDVPVAKDRGSLLPFPYIHRSARPRVPCENIPCWIFHTRKSRDTREYNLVAHFDWQLYFVGDVNAGAGSDPWTWSMVHMIPDYMILDMYSLLSLTKYNALYNCNDIVIDTLKK